MYSVRFLSLFFFYCLLALGFFACHPALKKEAQRPEESLRPIRFFYPHFSDDMDLDSLALAVRRNLSYLDRLDPEYPFIYGRDRYTCRQVRASQEAFLRLLLEKPGPDRLNKKVKENFKVYRATGRVGNTKTLFTGYYEPLFEGCLTPDEVFCYPLYKRPDDLVKIDLEPFGERFKGQSIFARIEGKTVTPYYSRYQIDIEKILQGRGLEIAWLKDPVDVSLLHIQGSGRLLLPDGTTISVGYQAPNGRPYRSIGRYMVEKGFLEMSEVSMQTIRRFLSDHPERIEEILTQNPSYIFFQILENGPFGNLNVPLTAGRSLALDSRLFPKGALAFLTCEKPVVDDQGEIAKWTKFSRFAVVQDTGGAIKGAGRADLFWGNGTYAEIAAGHMKHEGELYIFIKKFD